MRISTHPDHFTLINSPRPEVLEASLKDLEYHDKMFKAMNLETSDPKVFGTWQGKIPKLHFSSPRSPENCRAHANDIDIDSFYDFLLQAKEIDHDFDVMIEAKNKDAALFNLMKSLQGRQGINIINEAEISM